MLKIYFSFLYSYSFYFPNCFDFQEKSTIVRMVSRQRSSTRSTVWNRSQYVGNTAANSPRCKQSLLANFWIAENLGRRVTTIQILEQEIFASFVGTIKMYAKEEKNSYFSWNRRITNWQRKMGSWNWRTCGPSMSQSLIRR